MCDCGLNDFHKFFTDEWEKEEAKAWYRCDICDKSYCNEIVRMKRAQKDIKTGASKTLVTMINDQNSTERAKASSIPLSEKLAKVRENAEKLTVVEISVGLKNLYHETFLLRIVSMLDFYCSLAVNSPSTLAMVHKVSDPAKLNTLVRLLICGLPRMKMIVLKIFQNLLKLEIPLEILDKAVSICMQGEADDDPEVSEIKQLMENKTTLNLDQTPFFKMIYNLLCGIKQKMWEEGLQSNVGLHAVENELAGIFRILVQEGDRNIFTQKLIGKCIKNSLLKVQTFSEPELDTLMSIISESNWRHFHAGTHCTNSSD